MMSDNHPLNPAGFPMTITGNDLVLEWKRGYDDKPECWWLRDANPVSKQESQTYKHYATLKATPRTRWSRTFMAWYSFGGATPPQSWLDLVGCTTAPAAPEHSEHIATKPAQADVPRSLTFEEKRQSFLEVLRQKRELEEKMQPYHQFQAVHRVMQQASETLHHLTYCKLLPAIATPPLDDPWS